MRQILTISFSHIAKPLQGQYTLGFVLHASRQGTCLILGTSQSLVVGKVMLKELLFFPNPEKETPDIVEFLRILKGKHHTIELINYFPLNEEYSILIFPLVRGNKDPESYKELWIYLDNVLEVNIPLFIINE